MKKAYFQPEVTVASICLESMILDGSPAGDQMNLDPNGSTDKQW